MGEVCGMLDLKAWIEKVTNVLSVDFIVEQGTDSGWTYRKWNSGIFEAWYKGTLTVSCTTASAAYGGYRSTNQIPISIPSVMQSWTFINIHLGKMSAGAPWTNDYYRSGNTITGFWHAGTSEAAQTRDVSLYCRGTWK